MQMALYCWRATDRLCQRNERSLWSPVRARNLPPMSLIKSEPLLLMGPSVSKAIGTKWYVWTSELYFSSFLRAAASAALPAAAQEDGKLYPASVSVTVTSQVTHLPSAHGICDMPSGLLPSVRTKPVGSFMAGTLALFKDCQMMSLRKLWRAILPDPLLQ